MKVYLSHASLMACQYLSASSRGSAQCAALSNTTSPISAPPPRPQPPPSRAQVHAQPRRSGQREKTCATCSPRPKSPSHRQDRAGPAAQIPGLPTAYKPVNTARIPQTAAMPSEAARAAAATAGRPGTSTQRSHRRGSSPSTARRKCPPRIAGGCCEDPRRHGASELDGHAGAAVGEDMEQEVLFPSSGSRQVALHVVTWGSSCQEGLGSQHPRRKRKQRVANSEVSVLTLLNLAFQVWRSQIPSWGGPLRGRPGGGACAPHAYLIGSCPTP